MSKHPFSYYNDSELARAATAPKISTHTRIQMLDEIKRRETEQERADAIAGMASEPDNGDRFW